MDKPKNQGKINLDKEIIFDKGTDIVNDLISFGKDAINQIDKEKILGKGTDVVNDVISFGKDALKQVDKEKILDKGTDVINEVISFGKGAIKQADEKLNIKNVEDSIMKIKDISKDLVNTVLVDEFLGVNTKVSHSVFGDGIVVLNDKKIIKVRFDNGEVINFSYDTCKKDMILNPKNRRDEIDKVTMEKLIKESDFLYENEIFSEKALVVNKKIVGSGCKEIKYYLRLANCYKNLNKIEEAIEIYKEIAKMDKKNKIALDNLTIYGKGIYQKFEDKSFSGVYRDVGSPPAEEVEEWYIKELKKVNKYE